MSVQVLAGQVAPYESGFRYNVLGEFSGVANTYRRVAYSNDEDDEDVWFAGTIRRDPVMKAHMDNTMWHRGIEGAVTDTIVADKWDGAVYAIAEDEYQRLVRCEVMWWLDYHDDARRNPRLYYKLWITYAHQRTHDIGRIDEEDDFETDSEDGAPDHYNDDEWKVPEPAGDSGDGGSGSVGSGSRAGGAAGGTGGSEGGGGGKSGGGGSGGPGGPGDGEGGGGNDGEGGGGEGGAVDGAPSLDPAGDGPSGSHEGTQLSPSTATQPRRARYGRRSADRPPGTIMRRRQDFITLPAMSSEADAAAAIFDLSQFSV